MDSKTVLCLLLLTLTSCHLVDSEDRARRSTAGILAAPQLALSADSKSMGDGGETEGENFEHRVLLCNAYPLRTAMKVELNKAHARKLNETANTIIPLVDALEYKKCHEVTPKVQIGDVVDFKLGENIAGSFAVSSLPHRDSVLALIITRHDTLTNSVAFISHEFSNLLNAQMAVIDAYKGQATSRIEISRSSETSVKKEELLANTVVATNTGKYNISLVAPNGSVLSQAPINVEERGSYVLLRVGAESKNGPSYPEEVVVFPGTEQEGGSVPSGASERSRSGPVLLAALLVALVAAKP